MLFPKEFFDLLLKFAQKISEINQISFEESLFLYTCLPIRIGLGFSELTVDNPIWLDFISNMKDKFGTDQVYTYYLEHTKDKEFRRKQFGCFSYDWEEDKSLIRIHFANNDNSPSGVLSPERRTIRISELKEMFSDVKIKYPRAMKVVSASWLYNINSFKELFPRELFEHSKEKVDYYSLGIWGQFIDKKGNLKIDSADTFMKAVRNANSMEDVNNAFPLKNLYVEEQISCFYTFYNIKE